MQFESSNLVELLQQWAIAQPEKAIFTFLQDGEIESEHLTYYALDQKARIIATHLQTLCAPGDRVLMLYPPGLDFVTGLFGCLYAGVVAVPLPLPKRQRAARNRLTESWCAIASNAQATVALSTTAAIAQLKKQLQASETSTLRWVATNEIQASPQRWEYHKTTPDTLALLQYTSGSTSTPKGVISFVDALECFSCDCGPGSVSSDCVGGICTCDITLYDSRQAWDIKCKV